MQPSATPMIAVLAAAAVLSGHAAASADVVQVLVNHADFVVLSDVPGMGTPHATIQPGDTVWWSWIGFSHSVTADDASFNSGVHSPPFNFLYTFDQPGVYRYYCTLHGAPGGIGMAGTITVL